MGATVQACKLPLRNLFIQFFVWLSEFTSFVFDHLFAQRGSDTFTIHSELGKLQ